MKKAPKMVLGRVGQCIYCGSRLDLSDEHIIPFSLNGPYILLEASCKNCADITSEIERKVAREYLYNFRALYGYPSRRKKNYPKNIPFRVKRNGVEEIISIPIEKSYITIPFPVFAPPTFFSGETCDEGIVAEKISIHQIQKPSLKDLKTEYHFDEIIIECEFRPIEFAQMLTKIAYGFAIAHYGLDCFKKDYVLPLILGQRNDFGRFVGSSLDFIQQDGTVFKPTGNVHNVTLCFNDEQCLLAHIKLFSYLNTPNYIVVIGRLRDEAFQNVKNGFSHPYCSEEQRNLLVSNTTFGTTNMVTKADDTSSGRRRAE